MSKEMMTVRELRELLAGYADETPVVVAYPAHDYWRSTVANAPTVDMGTVELSAYHGAWRVVESEEGHSGKDSGRIDVVMLTA